MTPPRENTGAIPIIRLAELDSSVHHIREQNDRDRRAQAERNRDVRDDIDAIRIDAAETKANVASLTKDVAVVNATLGTVRTLLIALAPIIVAALGAAVAIGRHVP